MALSGFVIRLLFLVLPGIIGSKVYRKLRGRTQKESWESFLEILLFSVVSYSIAHLSGYDRSSVDTISLTAQVVPPFTIQSPNPVDFPGPPSFTIPATQPTPIQPQPGSLGKTIAVQISHPVTISTTQPVLIEGSPVAIGPGQDITIQPDSGQQPVSIFEAFVSEQVPIAKHVTTIVIATLISLVLAVVLSYVHNFSVVNWVGRKIGASRRSGDEDTWTVFNTSDDIEWVMVRDFPNNRVYYGSIQHYSDSDKPREVVLADVYVYSLDKDEWLYCSKIVYLSSEEGWTVEVPLPPAEAAPKTN